MIRHQIFDKFEKEIKKLSIKDQVNEKFTETTEMLFSEFTIYFKKQSADLLFDGAGWAA